MAAMGQDEQLKAAVKLADQIANGDLSAARELVSIWANSTGDDNNIDETDSAKDEDRLILLAKDRLVLFLCVSPWPQGGGQDSCL